MGFVKKFTKNPSNLAQRLFYSRWALGPEPGCGPAQTGREPLFPNPGTPRAWGVPVPGQGPVDPVTGRDRACMGQVCAGFRAEPTRFKTLRVTKYLDSELFPSTWRHGVIPKHLELEWTPRTQSQNHPEYLDPR